MREGGASVFMPLSQKRWQRTTAAKTTKMSMVEVRIETASFDGIQEDGANAIDMTGA